VDGSGLSVNVTLCPFLSRLAWARHILYGFRAGSWEEAAVVADMKRGSTGWYGNVVLYEDRQMPMVFAFEFWNWRCRRQCVFARLVDWEGYG